MRLTLLTNQPLAIPRKCHFRYEAVIALQRKKEITTAAMRYSTQDLLADSFSLCDIHLNKQSEVYVQERQRGEAE